jgi:cytochrome c553
MAGFAGALTDKDMENLAAYYASQPAVVAGKW